METSSQRLIKAIIAAFVSITVGTIGFWYFGTENPTWFESFYMTIITLSTVGYGEVVTLDDNGKLFASFLILLGMSTLLYFGSTIVSLWVETDLNLIRKRRKMQKTIDNLEEHIIVCGCGTTGKRVVQELMDTKTPFVVVDIDEDSLEATKELYSTKKQDVLTILGDATDDSVLEQAGIARAKGLVAALKSDKDNLYLIFSTKQIKSDMRIVARATEKDAPAKMEKAGADKVVSPNMLGGMRIASEMIRPHVAEFIDEMLRGTTKDHRIEQVALNKGSSLIGKTVSDSKIRKATDVLVIAIRKQSGEFIYNPQADTVLTENTTLVVLGAIDAIITLREKIK